MRAAAPTRPPANPQKKPQRKERKKRRVSSNITHRKAKKKTHLLIQMQYKHDPSERDHRTHDRQADPRDPLPRAKVQLLVPLVLPRARINHELRVGNDHLERGDAPVRRAREQILDVIVRPPEPEERVRRVQRLVRRLRELRDLRGRAPS
jgi:hypothetical protein